MNGAQRLALDTFSNALGTIIAVAVIYVVGVIAGVFTARAFLLTLIAVSFVANVSFLGCSPGRAGRAGRSPVAGSDGTTTTTDAKAKDALSSKGDDSTSNDSKD
jgi:hypothetical protein